MGQDSPTLMTTPTVFLLVLTLLEIWFQFKSMIQIFLLQCFYPITLLKPILSNTGRLPGTQRGLGRFFRQKREGKNAPSAGRVVSKKPMRNMKKTLRSDVMR